VKNIKNQGLGVRQEILVPVNVKNVALWVVTPCSLTDVYRSLYILRILRRGN